MSLKPKAPRWLTEAFKDGVDERARLAAGGLDDGWYPASERCQLAQHDPSERPCSGRLERFHYVNRQRIENALGALLFKTAWLDDHFARNELILLAAWDPRVGGISCEAHHRRLDSALTPTLIVPYSALPSHVIEWVHDWGLESQLEARYPSEVANV